MSYTPINNGDSGLVAREKINNMTAELYSGKIVVTPINNSAASFTVNIAAGSYVWKIWLRLITGTATVRVGTTPNGDDILPDQVLSNSPIQGNSTEIPVSETSYNLYFTLTSGTGTFNTSILQILDVI